jgi:hypothetical protein
VAKGVCKGLVINITSQPFKPLLRRTHHELSNFFRKPSSETFLPATPRFSTGIPLLFLLQGIILLFYLLVFPEKTLLFEIRNRNVKKVYLLE